MQKKVAILYDRIVKWGGAERVLLALHEIFPSAPIYTSVYNSKTAPWASVFPEIHTSFLQKIPGAINNHELFAPLMPLAFEQFDFSEYDLVISVTSEAAKGVITKPSTKHVCYMLTPTRYLYSHQNTYFQSKFLKIISKPIINYLKKWDQIASQHPDKIIAISTVVQSRIKKYYNRDSQLIYPPIPSLPEPHTKYNIQNTQYYLIVSRLVRYKRVDLAIKTFNKSGDNLIIIGTGRDEKKLKSLAKPNITFLKNLTDQNLANYYKYAVALIHPQEEDFGLSAVEAQSLGTPVIAYAAGGALDTVINNKTGVLFKKQTVNSLSKAIDIAKKIKFNTQTVKNNAKRFRKEKFKREFRRL